MTDPLLVPDRAPGAAPFAVPALPQRPRSGSRALATTIFAVGVVIVLLVYSWIDTGGSLVDLWNGFFGSHGLIRNVIPASLPPQASQFWPGVRYAMTTLAIAVLSIFFGTFWAIAMIPLAARNLAPSPVVFAAARLIQAVLRAIPELIMLLFFLITIGLSPFAAVVALTFHGIGVMGKLYAEAVEEMDMAPVEALRVAGAGRIQVFLHGVLPEVRTTLLGLTLYRLDANFRSAVTLGAVGGGGIGFLIDNQLGVFNFQAVTTYMILLVVFVLVIERVSAILRRRYAA
jgi:phosphonate transport system permease protein